MKYLVDTHIIIWLLENKLPKDIESFIRGNQNNIFMSDISIWEIVIKKKKGKLKSLINIHEFFEQKFFHSLPITKSHILNTESLDLIYLDPFDRLLVSQAKTEKMTLITHDKKMFDYPVSILRV